jgi:hypothetical protein
MNSAQRRKSRREHPHVITVRAIEDQRWYEHDQRVSAATRWCKKNCKGSWVCSDEWDEAVFKFAVHKDATIFALKWL